MPAIHSRSHVPPPWMKVRWARLGLVAFTVLCGGSALGGSTFPLILTLGIAWLLWRSERDGGRH